MASVLLALLGSATAYTPCPATWEFAGPLGYIDKSGMGLAGASFSATNGIVGKDNVWFAGTVNGGVWRTKDLYGNDYNPTWEPVTDNQPVTCASISSLAQADFDPKLVAAGCGGASSGMMAKTWNVINSGDWGGVMLSADGGDSWAMTSFPVNYYVTAIVFTEPKVLVVAARSHAQDQDLGGIWRSEDMGQTWTQTFDRPVYDIATLSNTTLLASVALDTETVWSSTDGAKSWASTSSGLEWGDFLPQLSQLTINTAGSTPVAFIGAFAVKPTDLVNITSPFFYAEIPNGDITTMKWQPLLGAPFMLDPDHMAKDRLAILADPEQSNIIYVAGNAAGPGPCEDGCTSVFRVDWTTATWTFTAGMEDTVDNTQPHPDCRKMAWDYTTGNLILAQDGGVAVRTQPRAPGGRWIGISGVGAMEYIYAHWDNRLERWIAGAQDNDVQLSAPAAEKKPLAEGYLGCDGQRTAIDNAHCPARLLSSCQNLDGLTAFYDYPTKAMQLDLSEAFPEQDAFPYMNSPWCLNSQRPSEVVMWVNGSTTRDAGIWKLSMPEDLTKFDDDIANLGVWDNDRGSDEDDDADDDEEAMKAKLEAVDVTFLTETGHLYEVVAGGFTAGKSDPDVIVGMNEEHLFVKRGGTSTLSPLPSVFATPVIFDLDEHGEMIIGPISHGKTVSLAVSPADSEVVAVTGWPQNMETGREHVWYSDTSGQMWSDITGDLLNATRTVHRARPSGLLIIEFSDVQVNCILVGTVDGVFITWSDETAGKWTRLGDHSDFPIVKTQSLTYEHYSDVLVAGTYGRGVYTLKNAKQMLLLSRAQQRDSSCSVSTPSKPASSAKFFPPQQTC